MCVCVCVCVHLDQRKLFRVDCQYVLFFQKIEHVTFLLIGGLLCFYSMNSTFL